MGIVIFKVKLMDCFMLLSSKYIISFIFNVDGVKLLS